MQSASTSNCGGSSCRSSRAAVTEQVGCWLFVSFKWPSYMGGGFRENGDVLRSGARGWPSVWCPAVILSLGTKNGGAFLFSLFRLFVRSRCLACSARPITHWFLKRELHPLITVVCLLPFLFGVVSYRIRKHFLSYFRNASCDVSFVSRSSRLTPTTRGAPYGIPGTVFCSL